MILTVYSYPVLASTGLTLVFFLQAAALCYFTPTALVAAIIAMALTVSIYLAMYSLLLLTYFK